MPLDVQRSWTRLFCRVIRLRVQDVTIRRSWVRIPLCTRAASEFTLSLAIPFTGHFFASVFRNDGGDTERRWTRGIVGCLFCAWLLSSCCMLGKCDSRLPNLIIARWMKSAVNFPTDLTLAGHHVWKTQPSEMTFWSFNSVRVQNVYAYAGGPIVI